MYCVVCINRACLLFGCAAADVCCSETHDISVRHMLDVMVVILREADHIQKDLVEGILLQLLASDEVRGISNPYNSTL